LILNLNRIQGIFTGQGEGIYAARVPTNFYNLMHQTYKILKLYFTNIGGLECSRVTFDERRGLVVRTLRQLFVVSSSF
jgi:hypothetical protein